jgi:hypothetical protein
MKKQISLACFQALLVPVIVTVLGGCGRESVESISGPLAPDSGRLSQQAQNSFTIGPLNISGIEQRFPDGRWQFRDATLSGPVTGTITGTADVTLNGNFDQFAGSGPAWGTVTITTTSGDVWAGSLTGYFLSGLPAEPGIQLFSHVVLHGPDGQTIRVQCNETTAVSETLVCTPDNHP